MKIPFDIAYRSFIESGEYKVETRDGRPARVICWDRFDTEYSNYIVALVTETECETAYYYYEDGHLWSKANDEGDSSLDLFIITPEPERTEFEQEVYKMTTNKKHAKEEANKLLELAKKEICKECSANLEGYIKGRTAANKDYQQGYMDGYKKAEEDYKQSVTYHYPIYQSPCFNGGVCTNPHHDCINCPRQSSGTAINTSGTNKAE